MHFFRALLWLHRVKERGEFMNNYSVINILQSSYLLFFEPKMLVYHFHRQIFQIAGAEKKAKSLDLEENDEFGGNSSLVERCKAEHRFLKSVVEKVTSQYSLDRALTVTKKVFFHQ